MSDFRESLKTLGTVKKASIPEVAEAKRLLLSGKGGLAELATAQRMNTETAQANPIINDIGQLTASQIYSKYGGEVAGALGNVVQGYAEVNRANNGERGAGEITSDLLSSIGAGAHNMIGDALGVNNMVVEAMGLPGSPQLEQNARAAAEALRENRSQTQKNTEAQFQREGAVRRNDSQIQYNKDVKEGKENAGLRKFGRDVLESGSALIQNPAMATEMMAESATSLIASSGGSKLIAQGLIRKRLMDEGKDGAAVVAHLASKKGQEELAELSVAAVPAINGILEGGSAAGAVRSEILAMTDEELKEASPEYNTLLETMSPEEARQRLTTDASLMAGVTQGIMGYLTGHINAKFDAAPLASLGGRNMADGLKKLGKSVLSEGIEEGVQSGSGEASVNAAIQTYADSNRGIMDNVGEAVGTGAVVGAGMAGALQGPGAAISTAADTAQAGGQAVGAAVQARREATKAKVDATSPTNAAETEVAVAKTKEIADTILNAPEPVTETGETVAANPVKEAIKTKFKMDEASYDAQETEPQIRELVKDADGNLPDNRLDYLVRLADNFEKKTDLNDNDKDQLVIEMFNSMSELDTITNEETLASIQASGSPEQFNDALTGMAVEMNRIKSNPVYTKALDRIMGMTQEDAPAVTEENINTPEVTAEIKKAEAIAVNNPMNSNPQFLTQVMELSKARKIPMEPAMAQALNNAIKLTGIAKVYEDTNVGLAEFAGSDVKVKPANVVRENIVESGFKDARGQDKSSLTQHVATITQSILNGNGQEAKAQLEWLTNFAQSNLNKIEAYGQSAQDGKRHGYQAFSENGWYDSLKYNEGAQVHKGNANSLANYRYIFNDTSAIVATQNALAQAYPDLGIQPLAMPELSRNVASVLGNRTRKANDAMKAILAGQGTLPTTTSQKPATPPKAKKATKPAEAPKKPTSEAPKAPERGPRKIGGMSDAALALEEANVPKRGPRRIGGMSDVLIEQQEAAAKKKMKIADRFPNLFKFRGKNRFLESFKFAPNKSQVAMADSPAAALVELADRIPSEAAQDTLKQIATKFVPEWSQKVQDALGKSEVIQRAMNAKDTTDPTLWDNARLLGVLEQQEDGSFKYNQAMLESAIMGIVHWTATAQPNHLDAEKAAKIFGVQEEDVSYEMLNRLNAGLPVVAFKTDAVRIIKDFWGVEADASKPISDNDGLVENLASEIMSLMIADDVFDLDQVPVGDNPVNIISLNEKSSIAGYMKTGLKVHPDAIGEALGIETEKTRYIGVKPPKPQDFQLRNRATKLKGREVKTLERLQGIPFTRNADFVDGVMGGFEPDFLKEILGFVDIENTPLNEVHKESIIGKNRQIEMSVDGVIAHDTALHDLGDPNAPTYFAWKISSVGRRQMQGLITPQGDKLMREAFTTTNAELDLDNPAHDHAFWLSVGQSLGVKIEKNMPDKAVQLAQDELKKYRATIEAFKDRLEGEDYSAEQLADIRSEMNGQASAKILHALMAVAKYETATGEGRKKFEHRLAIEADGVTNGPMNAMVNFMTGEFTPRQLKLFGKGGMFVTNDKKTLNEHQAIDGVDLYQTTADILSRVINGTDKSLRFGNNKQLQALVRLMSTMNSKDFALDIDGEVLTIKRGATKNPLTITVYGSGMDGLGGKVAGALMDSIYEELSRKAQGNGKYDFGPMAEDMKTLFGIDISTVDPVKFEFTEGQKNQFTNVIMDHYAPALDEAIRGVMGSTIDTMLTFQRATNIQSLVLADRYQKEIDRLYAQMPNKNQLLSSNEYARIASDLEKFGAIIHWEDQTADLSSKSKANSGKLISRSLSNPKLGTDSFGKPINASMTSEAMLRVPASAGVRARPIITIMRGDALMGMNIYTDPNPGFDQTLDVFDGIELPADKAAELSEIINGAVYDSWMVNHAENVLNSFADFMRQPDVFKGLSNDTVKALGKLFSEKDPETGEYKKPKSFSTNVQNLLDDLKYRSENLAARKAALKQVKTSVDQMAGMSAPAVKGTVETVPGQEHVKLNELMNEALKKENKPVFEKPSKELDAAITKAADKIPGTEIRRVQWGSLGQLVRAMTPAQQKLYNDLIKKFDGTGIQFLIGTADELNAHKERFYHRDDDNSGSIEMGQFDPNNNIIYIANASGETILHEAIHAVVANKIAGYYQDANNVGKETQQAIPRLEELMNEFLERNYRFDSPTVQQSIAALKNQIDNETDPAVKLNEFIAWTLTNQNLADTASKIPARGILAKALQYLKKFIGYDMLSNIRFNAKVIALEALTAPVPPPGGGRNLNQKAKLTGASERATNLNDRLNKKLQEYTMRDQRTAAKKARQLNQGDIAGKQALIDLAANGFNLGPIESLVFRKFRALFDANAEVDKAAALRGQQLFDHVVANISAQDFSGPDAQNKYQFVIGAMGIVRNKAGVSDLLPTFLALSQVDTEFRDIVNKIALPKKAKVPFSNTDEALEALAGNAIESLSSWVVGEDKKGNTALALDDLALKLTDIKNEEITMLENMIQQTMNTADSEFASFMDKYATKGVEGIQKRQAAATSKVEKAMLSVARLPLEALSKSHGKARQQAITSMMNETDNTHMVIFRDLLSEIVGKTESTGAVFDLVNRAKYMVSSIREQYREKVPGIIGEKFSRKLTKAEWTTLHTAIGKTDIASLLSAYNLSDIKRFFHSDKALQSEIQSLEGAVGNALYIKKAKELAKFMVKGETSEMLLRNSHAIANLYGMNVTVNPTQKVTEQIDHLATLYAVREMEKSDKDKMTELFNTEDKGVEFSIMYLAGYRAKEYSKINNAVVQNNQYKGHIPSETGSGINLVVENNSEHNRLVMMGYTKVGPYSGSDADGSAGSKSYYVSKTSGLNPYNQGVMQTVQLSQNGVDPRTGRSVNGMTAYSITGPNVKRTLARMHRNNKTAPGEHLMPVFNDKGVIVAFEAAISPEKMKLKERNTHFGEMIGAWAGRQSEEKMAQEFNYMLVDRSYELYKKERVEKSKEYINLAQSDDPVFQDNWKMIPREMKDYIAQTYGQDKFFPVRKDMILNMVGSRAASVGDLWTNESRVPEEARKAFKEIATFIFSEKAYQYAVTAERAVQAVVAEAKNIIVIKSLIVPVANILSNVWQLAARGVPYRTMIKQTPKLINELNAYLANRTKGFELDAELAAETDPLKRQKLKSQIYSIRDANRRMTIAPLIEAGEFGTIFEGLNEADAALKNRKFMDYIEAKVNELPQGVRTLGRYAIISKDTALYRGLNRSVQYGDFIAKAILYVDAMERQQKTEEQALEIVSEEFVNYNFNAGRARNYAESMGLLWFWNFKLRSMKIAHRMIVDNPVRALLTTLTMPDLGPITVGSPITDNAATVALEGRAGYSIGPSMGLRAPSLNPWYNIFG